MQFQLKPRTSSSALTHTQRKTFSFASSPIHSFVRLFDCYWLKLNITQIQLFIRNMNNANMTKANATDTKTRDEKQFYDGRKKLQNVRDMNFFLCFFLILYVFDVLENFHSNTHAHCRMSGLALEAA